MRVFVIYADVTLTKKPAWLDAFRASYDQPYAYHITLKQPCYVQKKKIPELKGEIQEIMAVQDIPRHRIDLVFDRLFVRPDAPRGGCIMINAQENPTLMKLQHDLREALAGYQNYLTPESSQWERDFKPHITIARHLPPEKMEEAKRALKEDFACRGSIDSLYLQVMETKNAEEAKKLENRTVFLL